MRISERIAGFAIIGLGLGLVPAHGFDGTRQPSDVAPAVSVDVVPRSAGPLGPLAVAPNPQTTTEPSEALGIALGLNAIAPEPPRKLTPLEAFRSAEQALRSGDATRGISALEYAAENGLAAAQWKLGRMYANGEGIAQNDIRAFEYFSRIANTHADDTPGTPRGRLVAKAFVSLGHYYLEGVPNSDVKSDPVRARQMYSHAASYFGDLDAQYHLARMYLEGNGVAKDPKQAARWLGLAANKGQYQAQAMLGAMLFKGQGVPRQAARGLMWLMLARDAAASNDAWIVDLYSAAIRQVSDDERALALAYLEQHLKDRR